MNREWVPLSWRSARGFLFEPQALTGEKVRGEHELWDRINNHDFADADLQRPVALKAKFILIKICNLSLHSLQRQVVCK